MKIKNKFKQDIAIEIALIFFLWLVSVLISKPIFNRPLDAQHEWLTAHTLVSMRAFEDWGFWKLLGASILVPKSYEIIDVDIISLTKAEGIYLSYPSLWLVLPYVIFKFVNLLPFHIDVSPQYLQTYNLIVNRLIGGVIIYYLYLEIINIFTGIKLTDYQKKLIAFLGLTGWMFTPPVLYWTQNVYFSDQAVLLPIYILFLISLRCKFKFAQLSSPSKYLLFITSLVACGIDWYGWVSVLIIMLVVLFDQFLLISKDLFSPIAFIKEYLISIKLLFSGMLVSGVVFLLQLLYYKDGFNQIYETFLKRSGTTLVDDEGNTLTPIFLLLGIVKFWIAYYPPILQKMIKPDNYYLIVIFVAALLVLGILYYFGKKMEDKFLLIYVYILILLVPVFQIYLLKQHSYMHKFSAFKMALPITFSLLILPALLFFLLLKNILSNSNFQFLHNSVYISIFMVSLGLMMIFSSSGELTKFANVSRNINLDKGLLVSRNLAFNDLPITNDELLMVASLPPEALWYTNRFIYSPSQLQNLVSEKKLNFDKIKKMKPVFLTFRDQPISENVRLRCEEKWINFVEKIDGREVIACKL